MGSKQSSLANSNKALAKAGKSLSEGKRGRKSSTEVSEKRGTSILAGDFNPYSQPEAAPVPAAKDETTEETSMLIESDEDSDSEADEQAFQEALMERRRVLEDTRMLKLFADFFQHPEKPVQVGAPANSRCFFDRPSAPARLSYTEAEEQAVFLEDLQAIKQNLTAYLHPERPVVTSNPYVCGRNFFSRYSAPEQEDPEDMNEKDMILADAAALKQKAVDYMHPEKPVIMTDPYACGHNFFAPMEDPEDAEERELILADAAALKEKAVDYMHPEKSVVTTDPFAYGRNFFTRPSAPSLDDEQRDECDRVLAECKALKQKAVDYLHPEFPVITTDPFACHRNFFSRYTTPEQEDADLAEERLRILEEVEELKKLAVDYKHPEISVVTTDPWACGRNYYSRIASPEQVDLVEADECARVLEEAEILKLYADHYLHPERPGATTDSTALGRNFFSRYSASGHAHMVHTFPSHEYDDHHEEHHWNMDEDAMFEEMRQELVVPTQVKVTAGDEGGSNLSRSPSSVMLFTGESIYD
jgi:hypothetical protein